MNTQFGMKSPTLNAMQMMQRLAPAVAEKAIKQASASKELRTTHGNLFIQPSGGKDGKPLNFSYCYYGINDADGKFIAGFNMSNKSCLMAVSAGALSENFLELLNKFVQANPNKEFIK